jgi:hypothetical protein
MGGGRRQPTADRGSPEWKKEAAVVLGSERVKSKRGSRIGREGAGEALEPEERR